MGVGIAQIASTSDCNVFWYDQNKSVSEHSIKKLEKVLLRLIEKGKINSIKKDSILSNIKIVESLESMKGSDLIIEAIVENTAAKKGIFSQIESIVSSDCVLATNTSSISITSLASCLKNPIRFIGIHFFNPAPVMPLVEIIPALQTNNNIVKEIHQLLLNWNKKWRHYLSTSCDSSSSNLGYHSKTAAS